MDGEDNSGDTLLDVDKNAWEKTTAQVIQSIEERCSRLQYEGSTTQFGAQSEFIRPWNSLKVCQKTRQPKSDNSAKSRQEKEDKTSKDCVPKINLPVELQPAGTALEVHLEDIKYIDDSAKSSLSTSLTDTPAPILTQPAPTSVCPQQSPPPPVARSCASVLEERYCQAFISSKNEQIADHWNRHYTSPRLPPNHHPFTPKYKHEPRLVVSPLPPEKLKLERDGGYSDTDYYSRNSIGESEHHTVQNFYIEKDFRYYFQHPYSRLFVSYFVIFCNFLVFAEDPVSHSHTESEIPVVGNVFSFVATKYPPQWSWCVLKVILWVIAIISGCFFGKYLIHHFVLNRFFRLKMFRDEQGTWMIMFLTSLMFIYMFSKIYNWFLQAGHPQFDIYRINLHMGITNANFMKAAACGTWVGDFVTAWMVTDMMLQDNLYPNWARPYRVFWRSHGRIRITIFWAGSVIMTALVVTLIVSDHISWDNLNRDFVATTELSRAFLASFILVMDLLIVMQDWDFPHFVCDLDVKLPGLHAASFKFNLFQKYVNMPDVSIHVTGKWFNYSIIVFVMILDLNMWKNQIFYSPPEYGQYIGPDHKVYSIPDEDIFSSKNYSQWTYEIRSTQIDPATNRTLLEGDISMNSRYLGYPLSVKGMAFMPSLIGFAMFGILTYLYGRFAPPAERQTYGRGRKRKREVPRSSWRRERGNRCTHYLIHNKDKYPEEKKKGNQLAELIVAWEENVGATKQCEKPL
ncbi:transmembrane protein 117-like [Uloborus diversus]|uniref:transmembrane protein 117-like n=1 Tax=Uloborus diversus TaxID=327109 RepID=UPI002409938F|nr:transmembrane protein 117-like [Uloborus diversus]